MAERPNLYYLLFIFSATLFTYNFHRIIRFFNHEINYAVLSERHNWIIKHKKIQFLLAVLAVFFLFFSLNNLPLIKIVKMLIPAVIPVLLYILPDNNFFKGLRQIPYLKVILVGWVWMYLCGYIPIKLAQLSVSYYFLAAQAIFIIAITLPFDIRDIKVDKSENVKSIATLAGEKNTRLISIILLFISYLLVWFMPNVLLLTLASWTLTILVCFTLVLKSSENKPELYFSGIIESVLCLPVLFYLLLRLFF
jgi:4-hydroxybenzoate polyprenyltransferase